MKQTKESIPNNDCPSTIYCLRASVKTERSINCLFLKLSIIFFFHFLIFPYTLLFNIRKQSFNDPNAMEMPMISIPMILFSI